ncbi:hypothetical protein GCM10023238_39980 [Streptomyces heliomycini]
MAENAGDKLGFVKRQVGGDLKRFKEFIERRGLETGACAARSERRGATRRPSRTSRHRPAHDGPRGPGPRAGPLPCLRQRFRSPCALEVGEQLGLPASTPDRMVRATRSSSATCGLVSE